jgi:hypothetical protein
MNLLKVSVVWAAQAPAHSSPADAKPIFVTNPAM